MDLLCVSKISFHLALKVRVTEPQDSYLCHSTHRMVAMARAGPVQSQVSGASSSSLRGVERHECLGHSLLPSGEAAPSRALDRK